MAKVSKAGLGLGSKKLRALNEQSDSIRDCYFTLVMCILIVMVPSDSPHSQQTILNYLSSITAPHSIRGLLYC